jgi:hypothetical protein
MTSVDEHSFVTVVIYAHGLDLITIKANDRQRSEFRKLTTAGKCGNLGYNITSVNDAIFNLSEEFAQKPHIPFAKKLDYIVDRLREHPENLKGQLQNAYESLESKKKEYSVCPVEDDWFSASQVSYNHQYIFRSTYPNEDWEREEFGIWFVDGSPGAQQIAKFKGKKVNITKEFGMGDWDFDTYLFELGREIQQKYKVKYVNFIDVSCRFSHEALSMSEDERITRLRSVPLSAPTPREVVELIIINGIKMEVIEPQPKLPPNWKYVKILRNDNYVFVNIITKELTPEEPTRGGFINTRIKKRKLRISKKINKKPTLRCYRRNISKNIYL